MIANAGRLNRRISIYGKVKSKTPSGFDTVKEGKLCDCWAAVYPLRMQDVKDNNILQTINTVKFTIRYRKNIDTNMTIHYKEKTFRIVGIVNPYYDNESLEITAEEISRGNNKNDKVLNND